MTRSNMKRAPRKSALHLAAVAAGAALILAGCAPAADPGDVGGDGSDVGGTLVIRTTPGGSFGDANMQAIFEPFEEETGIHLEFTDVNATVLAASVEAGAPKADIVDLGADQLQKLADEGALEPIDYDVMENFTEDDIVEGGVNEFYVARFVNAVALAYRTDVFEEGSITSWEDFLDTANFPGPRAVPDASVGSRPVLEQMLLADGVDGEDLFPLDVDRAFDVFTQLRPDIKIYTTGASQAAEVLQQKEVVMLPLATGRTQDLIDAGVPAAIVWNGAVLNFQTFGVLKGSENYDAAMKLIDYALSPDVQAAFVEAIAYGPSNIAALDLLDEDTLAKVPNNPAWADEVVYRDDEWWVENDAAVLEAWTIWKVS